MMKSFVKKLNVCLNRMGAKGIRFSLKDNIIQLLQKQDKHELSMFGNVKTITSWECCGQADSIEHFFKPPCKPTKNNDMHYAIHDYLVLLNIQNTVVSLVKLPTNVTWRNFMAKHLNDAAFEFLKIVYVCSSIEELELKLAIQGYLK